MNKNIEMELIGVSGGLTAHNFGFRSDEVERQKELKKQQEQQRKLMRQEMLKREGLADIRLRAGEDALRAAMRVQHQEMEIKAAQRAAMGL